MDGSRTANACDRNDSASKTHRDAIDDDSGFLTHTELDQVTGAGSKPGGVGDGVSGLVATLPR